MKKGWILGKLVDLVRDSAKLTRMGCTRRPLTVRRHYLTNESGYGPRQQPCAQLTLLNAFTIEKLRSFRLHQPLLPSLSTTTVAKYPKDYPLYTERAYSPFFLANSNGFVHWVSRYLEHADGRSTSGQPRFRIVNRAGRLARRTCREFAETPSPTLKVR